MAMLVSTESLVHNMIPYIEGKKTIGQCIDDTPIAYDVDKVIEQLKDASYNADMCDGMFEGECMEEWNDTVVPLDKAIEIVMKGGIV